MRIEVLHTAWYADGDEYVGGVHEIEKPTQKLLKLLAGAEANGSVKVHASAEERQKMGKAVESQSDSEKRYAKAQESGAWAEGNTAQHELDRETGAPTGAVG